MRNKIVLSAVAVVFSMTAMAQGVRVGIKGGLTLADMKYEPKDQTNGTPNANSLSSYHAGFILDLPLVPEFSVQTGALLSGKGSRVEFTNSTGTYTRTINPLYIEIPANFVFKPKIGEATRLYFGIGPYMGIGISGKSRFTGNTPLGTFYQDHDLVYGDDSGSDLKKTDFGGNFMVGFELGNGFIIGAQYGLSFTNNAPNGDNNAPKILRNKVFGISIGYLFSNKQ